MCDGYKWCPLLCWLWGELFISFPMCPLGSTVCVAENQVWLFSGKGGMTSKEQRLMEARLNHARNKTHIHIHAYTVLHICGFCLSVFSFMHFESTKWQLVCIYYLFLIQNKSHTSFHKWYGLCPQRIVFICKCIAVLAWKLSVSWNVVSTMEHV